MKRKIGWEEQGNADDLQTFDCPTSLGGPPSDHKAKASKLEGGSSSKPSAVKKEVPQGHCPFTMFHSFVLCHSIHSLPIPSSSHSCR